jgi:hypothetical protein
VVGQGFYGMGQRRPRAPVVPGLYQAHLPVDLGFYYIRLPETRLAQAELASEYGINLICYTTNAVSKSYGNYE